MKKYDEEKRNWIEVEEKRKKKKKRNSPLCSVKIFDAIILASFGTLGFVRIDLIDAPAPNVEPPVRSLTCCAPMSATLRQTQHSFLSKTHYLSPEKANSIFFFFLFLWKMFMLNFYFIYYIINFCCNKHYLHLTLIILI